MLPTVIQVQDEDSFGQQAAAWFIEAVKATGRAKPLVVLPSGRTPLPFYRELARRRQAGTHQLGAFFYLSLDEYLGLGPDDPRLLSAWIGREILMPLGFAPTDSLSFQSDAPDPAAEAARVGSWLAQNGPIDIAVLGLGANGHIGFNEPGSAFDSPTRVVDLTEKTINNNATYWGGQTVPHQALTLGLAPLRQAARTLLLVSGAGKAAMLAQALTGPQTPAIPASYLQAQQNLTVLADRAALSALPPAFFAQPL